MSQPSSQAVTLKAIKILERASEETLCFEAIVYIEGKKAGIATNAGHGGCNDYHPLSLRGRLDAIAESLPDIVDDRLTDPKDPSKPFRMRPDADTIIDELLDAWSVRRTLTKALKQRVLFLAKDGAIRQTRCIPAVTLNAMLANGEESLKRSFPNAVSFLNLLPFDEAVVIFKRAT